MAEEIREVLNLLNEKLAGLFPYRLELVNPGELQLLDKNARYMKAEQFQALVENVQARTATCLPCPCATGRRTASSWCSPAITGPWRPGRPGWSRFW